MNLTEVKKIAKERGVKAGKIKKVELIHTLQLAEGNFDCFETADNYCDQGECLFRSDCLG